MNYKQTLDWLYDQLPMFTRIGAAAIKKDLGNTIRLCELTGNPEKKFKSIHIAGTNGKGSVSHMLASILQQSGYKTGLYTSPHLKDFRERIKINGEMISERAVVAFVAKHKSDFEEIKPSFFEMTVALAFDYFANEGVEVAIIETGLGGRLDSTNVILPELSIITNIGLDHTDMLGDSLEKIAFEKAGIIKKGVPVVVGSRLEETEKVFKEKAEKEKAELFFAEERFEVKDFIPVQSGSVFKLKNKTTGESKEMQCQLNGIYQVENIATVVTAVEVIRKNKLFSISEENFLSGLAGVVSFTGLMGRWQQLGERPYIFCDTGHNKEGIKTIVRQLDYYHFNRLHVVIGMAKDKDVKAVLQLLPKEAVYYFCRANLPRSLDAEELAEKAMECGLTGKIYPKVQTAFEAAKKAAFADDFIFVGGSTFVVAEVL